MFVVLAFLAALVDLITGGGNITETIDLFGDMIRIVVVVASYTVVALLSTAVIFALGFVFVFLRGQTLKQRRPVDGAFPIQRVWLGGWRGRLAGRSKEVFYNPNLASGPFFVIDHNTEEFGEVEPGPGWLAYQRVRELVEATAMVRAAFPGDAVRDPVSKPPSAAGLKALMNGSRGKPPAIIDGTADEIPQFQPAYEPQLISDAAGALAAGEQQYWVLGQSEESGKLAQFNPAIHASLGVVGDPGTGKTTSAGMLAALQAIRAGWHTVIIDPDGGADWSGFRPYAEWYESDDLVFPDQVEALHAEFEQRTQNDMSAKPLFVVIEEYGDLIHRLRARKRSEAEQVDVWLSTLLRRGRKYRMSFLLLDQYPEHWAAQVISGTKAKVVFHLGPNQGAKFEEYHAAKLPMRGAFLMSGQQYSTWHVAPQLSELTAQLPQINGYRVLDGSRSADVRSGSAPNAYRTPTERQPNGSTREDRTTERTEHKRGDTRVPPSPEPPFDVRSAPLRDMILWWIDNIGGTQAEFRRWADERGVSASRGYVSDVFNGKYRDESVYSSSVADQLSEMMDEPFFIDGKRFYPNIDPANSYDYRSNDD